MSNGRFRRFRRCLRIFRIDKNKALCLIVHACDISHPAKPWNLHERWTEGVLEEFFRQGDLEASMGLPYSPLCDRHTVHVADSQIGFIDFIVEPTMVVCGELLVKMVKFGIFKNFFKLEKYLENWKKIEN